MCMKCDGKSDDEVRQYYLDSIEEHGWTICAVEGGDGVAPFAYTIGLTRYHDHPELLVSGLDPCGILEVLNTLGDHVRRGHRYRRGEVVPDVDAHRFMLIPVSDPDQLVYAQEIYGRDGAKPVGALQVVWSDHGGRWPWDRRWAGGRGRQDLYGRRPPLAA